MDPADRPILLHEQSKKGLGLARGRGSATP
jgi:hypothetical protein